MSTDIFFASDHHMGHANAIFKFKRADGSPLRDFSSVEEHDETIIARHNEIVGTNADVYFLGDFSFSNKLIAQYAPRMNGRKRLILGNHDGANSQFYLKYFKRLMSWRHWADRDAGWAFVCTHCPIHKSSFLGRYEGRCMNVHGHIHARVIEDPQYMNICMEQTNYYPVSYDEIVKCVKQL